MLLNNERVEIYPGMANHHRVWAMSKEYESVKHGEAWVL